MANGSPMRQHNDRQKRAIRHGNTRFDSFELDYDSRRVHHHAPQHLRLRMGRQVRDDFRDLDTQLPLLSDHGILDELIFLDVASGHTSQRSS